MSTRGSPQARPTGIVLLGRLLSANMNSTADQAIAINSSSYRVTKIVARNASTSLTTASGGVYSATAKGGSAIVAAAQVYSALTGSTKCVNLTIAAVGDSDSRTEASIYLSLTVAQGGAATADLWVYGESYS